MTEKFKKQNIFKKITAVMLAAVVFVSSFALTSFADTESAAAETGTKTEDIKNAENNTTETKAYDLSDNIIEFEEIGELVKKGNPIYVKAYDSASESLTDMSDSYIEFKMQMDESLDTIDETLDGLLASQKTIKQLSAADVEFMGVTMPKETALSSLSEGISVARAGKKQIKSALSQTAKSITDGKKKVDKALEPAADQMTSVIEGLVISYKQIEANRKMVEKQVSLYEGMLKTYKNMKSQGMSVDAEVLSYENQLEEAKISLSEIDAGLSQLKGNIALQLGFSADSDIIFGELKDPDKDYLEKRDTETDRKKTATGNDQVREAAKVDYYSSTGFKIRDSEENEALGKAYAAFDELLSNVSECKALYEAAELTLKKAELTRDMAKRQHSLGLTSEAAYEGQQMAYISYEASAELARLNLIEAIRQYSWAVNGLFSY